MLGAIVPHAEYAEDQLHEKGVLTAHVGYRGLQVGAVMGGTVGALRAVFLRKSMPAAMIRATWLRTIGAGSVLGMGVFAGLLPLRMMGLQRIEWQDRSWRLLANNIKKRLTIGLWRAQF